MLKNPMQPNIHATGVLKDRKEKERKIFEEIMTTIFPNLKETVKAQIQNFQQIPTNPNKSQTHQGTL